MWRHWLIWSVPVLLVVASLVLIGRSTHLLTVLGIGAAWVVTAYGLWALLRGMRRLGRLGSISLLCAAGIAAAVVLTHRDRTIDTAIVLPASPAEVWQVLAATDRYPEWNPMLELHGPSLHAGEPLEVTVIDAGGERRSYHARLLAASKNYELRWEGDVLPVPGLLQLKRKLILSAADPGGGDTLLRHGLEVRGLLAGPLSERLLTPFVDGMPAMNEALRAQLQQ